MGLFPFLVARIALAKPLALHPSPGAEVVILPRSVPERIELGIYHNDLPLALEVRTWQAPTLDHARVVDAGGGMTFVVLELIDGNVVARLGRKDDHFELSLVRGHPEVTEEGEIPTIEALFAGIPRHPEPLPEGRALMPLTREARTFELDPTTVRIGVGRAQLLPSQTELADVANPGWQDIDRWRMLLPTLRDGNALSVANYRIGLAHKRLGLVREASYYFGRSTETGFPAATLFLERADAALAVRRWDVARAACEQAWYRDADEALVLECLGVLSLATDQPAPGPTGRALAAVAERPEAQQLAGELLLRDGHAREAAEQLERATKRLKGRPAERAWLALGDAYLALGETDAARRAYLSAPHIDLIPLIEVRELLVRMLSDGIRRWPSWIPDLVASAQRGGPASADALYLLAQVHARYGDHEAAAADLARLWQMGVDRTDVASRLLDACTARAETLARDGRHAEMAALYGVCWQDGLAPHVTDIRLLDHAVSAWESLGLVPEALSVQRVLTTTLAGVSLEDPLQLGRLARLQARDGHPERALETLVYARRLTSDASILRHLDLDAAEAYAAQDRVDEALGAYARAAAEPELAAVARERAAVLELHAGRCEAALPSLADRLGQGPIGGYPGGELELMLVTCAVELRRPEEAIAAAGLALARATDDRTREDAKWIATAVAERTGSPLPEALRSEAKPWSGLKEENGRHEAFVESMASWSRGGIR